MLKQAEITGTFETYYGATRNQYSLPSGWYMIMADNGNNATSASGLICDNYTGATLKEAAEKLGVDRVSLRCRYDGRFSQVVWERGNYEIWSDGECLFCNTADPVAVMDSI